MRRAIMLILLSMILVSKPVYAQSIAGDNKMDASGSTTVTATVQSNDVHPEDSGHVKTGDESAVGVYISLLFMSMVIIVANRIRAYRPEEE